jgi:hypothetical protein
MQAEALAIIRSPAARQIQADCRALAQHNGLHLTSVTWRLDVAPSCAQAPYRLTIIGAPLGSSLFWFTQEEITGYSTGVSTAGVQERIRADLEERLRFVA